MCSVKLSLAKARVLMALFARPLTADTVNGLEDAYRETLVAIGSRGRLTSIFMIDLDREYSHGLYTLKYRLALYVDSETEIDLGLITGLSLVNNELRIDVLDGTSAFSVLLKTEAA